MTFYKQALDYHSEGRPGKIEIAVVESHSGLNPQTTEKSYQDDVLQCKEIQKDVQQSYELTTRGNLVAVVSNGTAVLGLGNIGPHASKPVMEGKGVLFKKFAGIDVFDIELNAPNPDDVIRFCQMLEPTVGGINLEDIKAPECFYIEEQLRKTMSIPVFHDDQHGTAIICGAALLNGLEVVNKKINEVRCVFIGGGAACIASATMFLQLGVSPHNLIMTDLDGVIYKGRVAGMNPYKDRFAQETSLRTLAEAMKGADIVVGLSAKGAISPSMLKDMARDPMIFALANPEPEITPEEVMQVRPDAIVATGRSDYPNQVNNVLGFPALFRGALDTRAKAINEEMKMAAVRALAGLAREDVPEVVFKAYASNTFQFGKDYLIPKPFDPRVLTRVAPAVARAAIDSGVARQKLDIENYSAWLSRLRGPLLGVIEHIKTKLKTKHSATPDRAIRVALRGNQPRMILQVAHELESAGVLTPVLMGESKKYLKFAAELELKEETIRSWMGSNLLKESDLQNSVQQYSIAHQREGMTQKQSAELNENTLFQTCHLLNTGLVDIALVFSSNDQLQKVNDTCEYLDLKSTAKPVGMGAVLAKNKLIWFADLFFHIDPTSEELAETAVTCAAQVKILTGKSPKIAMLSFSNFGSSKDACSETVRRATEIIQKNYPELTVDGEMQADTAVFPPISKQSFPFNQVPGNADLLIFPNLNSSTAAFDLFKGASQREVVEPMLFGLKKPISICDDSLSVQEAANMAYLLSAQLLDP